MKAISVLLTIGFALMLRSPASAEEFVNMAQPSTTICYHYQYLELPFTYSHDESVAGPVTAGISGFVVSTIEYASLELLEVVPNLELPPGAVIVNGVMEHEATAPDTFYFGFLIFSGILPSTVYDKPYFTLIVNTSEQPGTICFDTTIIPPSGDWSWTGPGDPIIPGFRDRNLEEGSPFIVEVVQFTCLLPEITVEPPEGGLKGYPACGSIVFEFHALWQDFGFTNWRILQGPGTIVTTSDTTGLYTCTPLNPGTYPVLVEAEYCCEFDYSWFDVTFLEGTPVYGDCDCSGAVDIDDIVCLVAYIFSGGPEPYGNPDCSGVVDIDDVVYMVEFIFNHGPEPCG